MKTTVHTLLVEIITDKPEDSGAVASEIHEAIGYWANLRYGVKDFEVGDITDKEDGE